MPGKEILCSVGVDVDVDERALIYLVGRYSGFDVLEFNRR